MNGNMIEMIPGSTGISPSPTILQQQHIDLYNNNNNGGNILSANAATALRTHSSKFPVSEVTRFSAYKREAYQKKKFNGGVKRLKGIKIV